MSGYSEGGASGSRPTLKTWRPRHLSSKSDLEYNLKTLQNRSADLIMNSPLGAASVSTMTTGVLSSGLRVYPQPKYKELGLSAERAAEWSRRVKLLFEMWAKSLSSDFYERNNFYELQRILFESYLTDGDSFCLFRRSRGAVTLKLQAIEAKRVSNPNGGGLSGVEMVYGKNRIINGLEVDKDGRLVAAWISNRLWEETGTDMRLNWQRVRFKGEHGNRNILHICYDTRPEMYRGAPLLSPVIETLKQVARYTDAELTSAIIKSFFSLFFVQPNSNHTFNDILPTEELNVQEYTLGSGTISALPRGVDVRTVESGSSQSTFESFVTQFTKQIGSALGLPVEVLLKEYKSSYSASRAAILEAEKAFRQRRISFVNDLCQPVYESWLLESIARGYVDAPGFFSSEFVRYCWSGADWRTEKHKSVDELKEVNAAAKRLELGLTTREQEAADLGLELY